MKNLDVAISKLIPSAPECIASRLTLDSCHTIMVILMYRKCAT